MKKTLKLLFLLSTFATHLMASPLKDDENVLFIPSIAYIQDGKVFIEVNAWVYENERRIGFNQVLEKYLGIKLAHLTDDERNYFFSQTALFKVDSERGKILTITFANGATQTLAKTDRAGRSLNVFSFDLAELPKLMNAQSRIEFALEDHGSIKGYANFHENKGHLVISDIDDTIKDSNVLDTKTLLKNTFLYPPAIANGMPQFFKKLAKTPNTTFVYVSSSPIQLYPTLAKFIDENYPKGILKLRHSTAWDEVIASKEESIAHKKSATTQLLKAYPAKSVTLIGDSGENDPEIYHDIFKDYPNRITHIIIRNVTNEGLDHARYQAFPKDIFALIAP